MRGPGRSRNRDENGTSAVEFAIVGPVVLLITFAIIQTALYFHARDTAQSAAREGVSYLRLAGNNADPNSFLGGAERVSEIYARDIGDLKDVSAVGTINTGTGRVSMVVVGTVTLPLGGRVEVQQTASGTLEQFRADLRDGGR